MNWAAKDIRVAPIAADVAREFVRRQHYSGKVTNNSQLHLGVFLPDARLHGVMQFGPPLDKSKVLGLVEGTKWNDMLELNRMAFDDALPRNSESRALSVAMRLIRKNYPTIEWVLSFADGTQCGDGTIYRASGFVLTDIKTSSNLARLPSGVVIHKMTLESNPTSPRAELGGKTYYAVTGGRFDFKTYVRITGASVLPGFQLRYVFFLNPAARSRLTVPVLPFEAIDKAGARMYRGERGGKNSPAGTTSGEGGATPTPPLQPKPAEGAS